MPNAFVGVHIDPDEKAKIEKICEFRGEGLSSFFRRALKLELARLGFLAEDELRALGVGPNPNTGVLWKRS